MSREVLVVFVGSILLLSTSLALRYLGRKWKIPLKTRNIAGTVIAAFGISLIVLLVIGASLDQLLFFSLACAFFAGAYLWLRNKFLV